MHATKVINLIRCFSTKELRLFGEYMESPFHIKDATLRRFFELIRKAAPEFNSRLLDRKHIYSSLFPEKKYDDLKIRHLCNLLYAACLDFLAIESFRKKGEYHYIELLGEFRERKLDQLYTSLHLKAEKSLDEIPLRNIEYYYQHYRFHEEHNLFIENQHIREQEPNLQKVSDALDIYFLINKLKIYCKVLSYGSMVNIRYEIDLIDEMMQFLNNGKYSDIPMLSIYHKSVLALSDPENESHYELLKDQIQKYFDELPSDEKNNILVLSKNYCIRKLNSGKQHFVRELFDIYKLEFSPATKSNSPRSLSPLTYKNVVAVGLRLKEFDWVNQFMEDNKGHLDKEYREAIYSYNKARYHFARKEFNKVVGLLTKVESGDVFQQIDVKVLLLKTYYERNNWISLESLIQSLRSFIKRKTILSYHKMNYLNFLFYLERMMKLERKSPELRNKIREDIAAENQLTEKEWLLENLTPEAEKSKIYS